MNLFPRGAMEHEPASPQRLFPDASHHLPIFVVILLSPLSVLADVIVDNGDGGTSKSGTWNIAGAPNFFGTNSRYSSKVDATYTFVPV